MIFAPRFHREWEDACILMSPEQRDKIKRRGRLFEKLISYIYMGALLSITKNMTYVAICITSIGILTRISVAYKHEEILSGLRDALGSDFSIAAEKLVRMFPEGVDVYEIKFLLHNKLRGRADLPTVKKLVKIFPGVLTTADDTGSFPLHIACRCCSLDVVQYLAKVDSVDLMNTLDERKENPLHYACRGANCDVVKYLLGKHMSFASERNVDGDLPYYLLCEEVGKDRRDYRENPIYLETAWQLILAYPELVM